MKKIITIAILFIVQTSFAQQQVNNYKYIIVPTQYNFQSSENQYQVNALTKFLFEKYGFTTYMSNEEYPTDLVKNPCLALKSNVVNIKSLLSTKVKIELVDCNNKVIFATDEAKTKEKEYKKAYYQAIRKAFKEIEELRYMYNPKLVETSTYKVESNKINNNKDTVAISKVTKTTTIVSDKAKTEINKKNKVNNSPVKTEVLPATIEGFYFFEKWGRSEIIKVGKSYVAKGGTEAFAFAKIYPTSIPNFFIIKWVAFKEPKLLKLNADGNLEVDSENGITIYKREI